MKPISDMPLFKKLKPRAEMTAFAAGAGPPEKRTAAVFTVFFFLMILRPPLSFFKMQYEGEHL